jgi:hypothetical protein
MSYFPHIDFVTADGPVSYQAELDCSVNQMNWLNEEHEHINEEIATKVAVAKADLINKYNIEEI